MPCNVWGMDSLENSRGSLQPGLRTPREEGEDPSAVHAQHRLRVLRVRVRVRSTAPPSPRGQTAAGSALLGQNMGSQCHRHGANAQCHAYKRER